MLDRTSGLTSDIGHVPLRMRAVSSPTLMSDAGCGGGGGPGRVRGQDHVVQLEQRDCPAPGAPSRRHRGPRRRCGAPGGSLISAASSTVGPLQVFMKKAVGFMASKNDSPISPFRLSAERHQDRHVVRPRSELIETGDHFDPVLLRNPASGHRGRGRLR